MPSDDISDLAGRQSLIVGQEERRERASCIVGQEGEKSADRLAGSQPGGHIS